ncbi:MAG: sigma-70 family RNA polymerase sigma factor [Bacteroidetes bacterium]|nr:MAG: sigma-70 family RNA polymerase sigma factor [Bacteroidota bacterium]
MNPLATTDAHILELLRSPAHAEQGLRLLMRKYQERLYWLIRQMVGNHEDANDVLQEVFIKVYRHADSFEGRSGLYTWLYRIATNEALGFLRKQQRRRSYSMDDEDNGLAHRLEADSWFDADGARQALAEAIERLPDKQRQVFELRYFDEMSYKDMSELLGTSVGALKASFHHAVKKVEEHLRATQTM